LPAESDGCTTAVDGQHRTVRKLRLVEGSYVVQRPLASAK